MKLPLERHCRSPTKSFKKKLLFQQEVHFSADCSGKLSGPTSCSYLSNLVTTLQGSLESSLPFLLCCSHIPPQLSIRNT